MDPRKLTGLVAFGAALCTALDQIHVRFGVLAYPKPFLLGQAWWVPFLFALATVAMVLGWRQMAALTGEEPVAVADDEVDRALSWLIGAYLASAFVKDHPWILLGVFVGAFAFRAGTLGSRTLVLQAIGMAIVGTAVEALLSKLGLFRYLVPTVGGVPVWLPGLYLHGAFLVRALVLHHQLG